MSFFRATLYSMFILSGMTQVIDALDASHAFSLSQLTELECMQTLTVQAGNSGLIVGLPSDPVTYGLTLQIVM